MLKLLTCTHGHFWESSPQDGDVASICPECGASAEELPSFDLVPTPSTPLPETKLSPIEKPGLPSIAGYEILEEIAKGPTGIRRFRAKQKLVGREVLLEVVLASEDTTQRAWSSLRSEAGLLGKLSHPHIVSLYEVGERDRQVFYNALEIVAGPTLTKAVGDDPLPILQVLALVEKLARAIEYAHQQGVIHRHLEPSAILMQPMEREDDTTSGIHKRVFLPRISGIGLPRRPVEGDPMDAELYAEPGFMSPEQAWGRTKELGPTTDVYGLGGILYWLITGRPPFRGPTLGDIIDAIQTAPLTEPSAIRSVPSDLEWVCNKALSRQPRRRYASAGEMAEDLRCVREGLPLVSRETSPPAKAWLWAKRRPAWAAVVLIMLLSIMGMRIAYNKGREENRPPSSLHFPVVTYGQPGLQQLSDKVALLTKQNDHANYRLTLHRISRDLDNKSRLQALALLENCPETERRFEWHYLLKKCSSREKHPIPEADQHAEGIAFAPGLVRALVVGGSARIEGMTVGQLLVYELPSMKPRDRVILKGDSAEDFAFSPNGRELAVVSGTNDGSVAIYPVEVRASRRLIQLPARFSKKVEGVRLTSVVWQSFADEENVTCSATNGMIYRADRRTSTIEGPMDPFGEPRKREGITRVVATSTGEQIASFTTGISAVEQWRYGITHGPAEVLAMAYSLNGLLAIAYNDNSIHLHDHGPAIPPILRNTPKAIRKLAFSPDGQRLALATDAGIVHIWGTDGTSWHELITIPANGTVGLAFSPDGKALATSGDGKAIVWGAVGE